MKYAQDMGLGTVKNGVFAFEALTKDDNARKCLPRVLEKFIIGTVTQVSIRKWK